MFYFSRKFCARIYVILYSWYQNNHFTSHVDNVTQLDNV